MSDMPMTPDDSIAQPMMVLPAAVAATRAARLGARGKLRQDLIDGRAALRQEREAAAAAAQTRSRRWLPRGARPAEANQPMAHAPTDPSAEAGPVVDQVPAAPEPVAAASPPPLLPDAATASVFATIMGGLGRSAPAAEVAPVISVDAQPKSAEQHSAAPAQGAEPEAAQRAEPEAAQRVEPNPPKLAEPEAAFPAERPTAPPSPRPANEGTGTVTALGPGMLARLRLVGYAKLTDLADADPAELRRALGDISRLLNVEAWIAEARRQAAEPAAD